MPLASRTRKKKKGSPPGLVQEPTLNPYINVLALDLEFGAKVWFWEGVRHPKSRNLSVGKPLTFTQ